MKWTAFREIVAEVFEIEAEQLHSEAEFAELETFDSMHILLLIVVLKEQAGIDMSPVDATELRYFKDLEQLAAKQDVVLTD